MSLQVQEVACIELIIKQLTPKGMKLWFLSYYFELNRLCFINCHTFDIMMDIRHMFGDKFEICKVYGVFVRCPELKVIQFFCPLSPGPPKVQKVA